MGSDGIEPPMAYAAESTARCLTVRLTTHILKVKWEVMELNHPSPKTADLQSAPLPLTV